MKLKTEVSILVLRATSSETKELKIVSELAEALPLWNGRDRVSPLFEIVPEPPGQWRGDFRFRSGRAYLIFAGPMSPIRAEACVRMLKGRSDRAWLTYGLFNLVAYTSSPRTLKSIQRWADQEKVRWELWILNGSKVEQVTISIRGALRPRKVLTRLSQFHLESPFPELRDATEEYCALLASASCRSAEVDEMLTIELEETNDIITQAATNYVCGNENGQDLRAIALLVDANAALSRFTSQTFSGFSPILETECHFWTHSLLGTGVANLALVRLRRFISRTLGEARIPEQIEALKNVTDPSLIRDVLRDGPIWNAPWLHHLPELGKKPILSTSLDPLCPLITYLSGRDGFHTTQVSLSAPLNVLTSCSSLRWSLLTITHEMSHRIIDGVLSYCLPHPTSEIDVRRAAALLNEDEKPANLLECLQFKILELMARLNASTPLVMPQERATPHHILDLIGTRREEVEEIMVHVFDFIYFYGEEPESYVPGIWRSWDAIPSLHRRLPAYVLRTLCAVHSKFWLHAKSTQESIAAVTAGMEFVAKNDRDNAYIMDALDYLRHNKETLQKEMRRRRVLTGIVRTFLQSPIIRQSVRGQAEKKPSLEFDGSPVENPLRFVEAHTSSTNFSALKSFIILCRLAFDTQDPEPLRLEGIHK